MSNDLIRKLDKTGSIDRAFGNSRRRSLLTQENTESVFTFRNKKIRNKKRRNRSNFKVGPDFWRTV